MECTRILQGHTGSVLCLQYDEKVIVTGSSDSTIRCVRDVCVDVHTMYICTVHVCVCGCICIHVYVCGCTYMNVCVSVYINVCLAQSVGC